MSTRPTLSLDDELHLIFGAICDGLRQEVRSRQVLRLRRMRTIPVAHESERGLAAILLHHLKGVGFFVQAESYLWHGDPRRQPDLRIWIGLNADTPLYLELKQYGWGEGYGYDHQGVRRGIGEDVLKLQKEPYSGMVVIGFSRPHDNDFEPKFKALTGDCFEPSSFREFMVNKLDFPLSSPDTGYGMTGLWIPDHRVVIGT